MKNMYGSFSQKNKGVVDCFTACLRLSKYSILCLFYSLKKVKQNKDSSISIIDILIFRNISLNI